MSFASFVIRRGISTTPVREGKRNFRKFPLYNKRGTRQFKEEQKINPDPDIPIDSEFICKFFTKYAKETKYFL